VPFMGPSGKICSNQIGHRWQYNRRMCFACCVIKATNKHSEYVILTAFPGQQLLLERVSIYVYSACLFHFVCRRTISILVHVKRTVGTRMILVILLWWSLSLMILSLLCEILLRLHVMRFIFWWHTDGMCSGKTVWNIMAQIPISHVLFTEVHFYLYQGTKNNLIAVSFAYSTTDY
jgi:hypothetical protein